MSKIYCLNRSANGKRKQKKSFTTLDLDLNLDTQRVDFIEVNYGRSQLGLLHARFSEMTSVVHMMILSAWKVDFNYSLESFEAVHVQGVRHLVDWSLCSTRNPRIIYISSTSSVGNWSSLYQDEPLPKTLIFDHHVAQETGYAESKHVAECILGIASEKSGAPIGILWVGQIAGPMASPGVWNRG